MIRFTGLFTIIPATILLTISFFVLLAAGRTDAAGLKKFGKIVAILLWISAGLVLLMGLYIIMTGQHPLISIINEVCKSCQMHQ